MTPPKKQSRVDSFSGLPGIFWAKSWVDQIYAIKVGPNFRPEKNILCPNKALAKDDKKSHRCCVFKPVIGCCAHPKAGHNSFLQPFSSFFVNFKLFFSDYTAEINIKHLKTLKKVLNEQKRLKEDEKSSLTSF